MILTWECGIIEIVRYDDEVFGDCMMVVCQDV